MPYEKIKIETTLMPTHYKEFHCLAAACQDSCCAGWKIEFSKKDYLAIKRAARTDALKEKLAQGMPRLREREHDNMYAEFSMNTAGQCHLLREDGLCDLQMECGPDALPRVCRIFPRKEVYTAHALEHSLSPACEGVLALLWDHPEGINFIEEPLPPNDVRYYTPKNGAAVRFVPLRSLFIDVLQERSLKLSQRMMLLGLLTQQLQSLDWEDAEAMDAYLERAVFLLHTPSVTDQMDKMPRDQQLFLANGLHLLLNSLTQGNLPLRNELLEVINEDWQNQSAQSFVIQSHQYNALEAQLEELLGHSEYFFENLMVSLAFHLRFPSLDSPEQLWKSYVNLCNLYSFYRFTAVCACRKEVSRPRLTHVLVQVSRALLHNSIRQTSLREELFKNDSATLAHMAILVGG